MSTHLKERKDTSVAYEPPLCGIRDYGQLRYAVFNPASEECMALFRTRIAEDEGGLSIGFCWACRGAFLTQFASSPPAQ